MTATAGPPSLALLAQADPELAASLSAGLAEVEARFQDIVTSGHPLLTDASRHLVLAGGKRVRPVLALLAAHLGDPTAPGVVDAAVVVELTHVATLNHDDVMDEAPLRHGVASTNARWSNTVAILTGDFLFARASDLTAGLGTEATHLQARTFARLVEGQIAETAGPADGEDPVAHYLRVLADKTASLFATSAELGARTAGADPEQVRNVARFAELFGVAFQLADDLIDIEGDSEVSGKTPGTDLREGVRTLPVLLVLQGEEAADAPLRDLLLGDLSGDEQLREALRLLRAHPAMADARRTLQGYVGQARTAAGSLPEGPVRRALEGLADFVLARTG